MTHFATLSLGSNIEPRLETLNRALDMIGDHPNMELDKTSKIYETPPWGEVDQSPFLNLCCRVKTTLNPEDLLAELQKIEQALGRVRLKKWGHRTVDIDIITFDAIIMRSDTLTLPHPYATQRGFVMIPLNEIAPDLVIEGKTVASWRSYFHDIYTIIG